MFVGVVNCWAALVMALLVSASPVSAQEAAAQVQPREVKIVTRVLPPMVIERDNALTGFSIDLMGEIANRLKLKVSYTTAPDVRALLEEVRSGRVELGISAVSITAAREAEFDFSQPMLNAVSLLMMASLVASGVGLLRGQRLAFYLNYAQFPVRVLLAFLSFAWLALLILPADPSIRFNEVVWGSAIALEGIRLGITIMFHAKGCGQPRQPAGAGELERLGAPSERSNSWAQ